MDQRFISITGHQEFVEICPARPGRERHIDRRQKATASGQEMRGKENLSSEDAFDFGYVLVMAHPIGIVVVTQFIEEQVIGELSTGAGCAALGVYRNHSGPEDSSLLQG